MRLLHYSAEGLSLTADIQDRDLPSYAILSHRWGAAGDEVTFEDMILGGGVDKPGYLKIAFCAEQTARDGLEYFWVDSCCINKADMTELSRSINSMFRWYQNAVKCYVYLEDVSAEAHGSEDDTPSQSSFLPAFLASKWFTRAWTLQELLASASVEFFSREGLLLGDKTTLENAIHAATGIPQVALRSSSLSDFSIEDRFRWAEKRQATLEEDLAYCLLGIFGVYLPLIYGEGRESAQRRLRTEVMNARKSVDVFSQPSSSRTWLVPYERNDAFTGRETELQRLFRMLVSERKRDQTARVTLVGLGGMGKTQVAAEFCYRTKAEHESVLWISAASSEALGQSYRDVASELHIAGWDQPGADVAKLVHNYLSHKDTGSWLLVFDNVDDDAIWLGHPGSKSLPKSNRGSILFTTRDMKLAVRLTGRDIVEMTEMDTSDCRQLLRAHLTDPDLVDDEVGGAADSLLEKLTRLPLAIVQAAMYINANGIELTDYMELLDEQDESEVVALLSEGFEEEGRYEYSGGSTAKHPVAKTWLISFEQIRTRHPPAADYLSFMACVGPVAIPPSLLPPLPSRKLHIEAMGLLKGYSFVSTQKPSAHAAIHMHRLVRLATRSWLRQRHSLEAFSDQAAEQLSDKLLRITLADRDVWKVYIPHAMYVFQIRGAHDGLYPLFLASRLGHCLCLEGRYAEAEVCLQAATLAWMGWKGPHFQTRDAMNNLALTWEAQGRVDDAIGLYREALAQLKGATLLDKDDRQTPAVWGNLVCALGKKGRMDEAEAESAKLIAAMEAAFGPDDQQTLGAQNNLAGLYHDQKRWADAIALHAHILETRRRVLGHGHVDTIISMNNLATSYRENGQLEETERLTSEAIEALKKDQEKKPSQQQKTPQPQPQPPGFTHVDVAFPDADMDRQTTPQGMELRELLSRRVLGNEHPGTLASMHGLALAWKRVGRDAEARDKMRACLEARRRVLGPEHLRTKASEAMLQSWDGESILRGVETLHV